MGHRASKTARFAEAFFGSLAKGTVIVVGIAAIVLAVLGGELTDLPTTRKECGYFLLVVPIVIIGYISFIELRH